MESQSNPERWDSTGGAAASTGGASTGGAGGVVGAASGAAAEPPEDAAQLSSAELLQRLREDRLWLLRQIDGGRWPEWRLDLAALERELGLLLEQAAERLEQG
jgi:hypothetical protein